MEDSQRDWSGLPKDILIQIHYCLSGGGIYRQLLRAVCPAWRAALPLAGDECRLPPPPSSLQIPLFYFHDFQGDPLMESVSPDDHSPNDILQVKSTLLVSSDEPDRKWIIQVHQTGPGKLSLFNPLTGSKFQFPPGMKLDQVNLLEFRITVVGTSLSLLGTNVLSRNNGISVGPLRKLVAALLPSPGSFVLMALSKYEYLCFWQSGLKKWSDFWVGDICGGYEAFSSRIKDIVSYKELFYAVDRDGRLLMFDPLLWREPVVVVSRPLIEDDEEDSYFMYMYLIVSKGSLYLAVRIEEDVRVYVLKEETGRESRWAEVKSIGDQVFFIGWDSTFSISSSDHGWNLKNRIYFGGIMGISEELDLEFGSGAGIYDLGSSHFVQFGCWADHGVHTRLFWPIPRWIAPSANLDPEVDPYEWLHELRRAGRLFVISTSLLEALQSMDV